MPSCGYIYVYTCVLCLFPALEPFSVLVLLLECYSRMEEVIGKCSLEDVKQSFRKSLKLCRDEIDHAPDQLMDHPSRP